jgi:hypothetical protein
MSVAPIADLNVFIGQTPLAGTVALQLRLQPAVRCSEKHRFPARRERARSPFGNAHG